LTTDWVLGQFPDHLESARLLYVYFILQNENEERRSEFQHGSCEGRLLGNDNFIEQSLMKAEEKFQANYSLEQVVQAVCTVYKMTPSMLGTGTK